MFNPNPCNSFNNTLNDSGMPGLGRFLPFTIHSYALALPCVYLPCIFSCQDHKALFQTEQQSILIYQSTRASVLCDSFSFVNSSYLNLESSVCH